jgi:hypothetical protein
VEYWHSTVLGKPEQQVPMRSVVNENSVVMGEQLGVRESLAAAVAAEIVAHHSRAALHRCRRLLLP